MYADMREDARDHARVRNAYFDQVCVLFVFGKSVYRREFGVPITALQIFAVKFHQFYPLLLDARL